jgi:hypothetical protein
MLFSFLLTFLLFKETELIIMSKIKPCGTAPL